MSQKTPLITAVNQFLIAKTADGLSRKSIESYRFHLERFAKFAPVDVTAVNAATVRSYIAACREDGLRQNTIAGTCRSLRCFSRWLESEDVCPSFWVNIKAVKSSPELLPPFTQEDVKAIVAACDSHRDKAIVFTLLDTGLRLSELCALTVDDIDLQSGAIVVKRGKGGKSRHVFIGAKAKATIAKYLRTDKPLGALWVNSTGRKMSTSGTAQAIAAIGKRANVAPCHPHRFRRSFAVFSLRNGMDLVSLRRIMGHSDTRILERYLDLTVEDLQRSHETHGALAHMLK
jgi:integrase/recombinase XerC